jgi:hypothetical protein
VNKWARGELDERSVHEEAEALYEQLEPLPEYPPEDARSIPIEVLSHLEILNHQLIVREDIPAILDFLETHPGKELEAWSQWEAYWNTLDYDERMERLRDNPYYSSLPVKRKSKKAP